jgi:thioredoxin-related protein
MKYLQLLNPIYWLSVFVTWIAKKERQRHLIAAINEANKINKETGKKMLVFNTQNGVACISKQDLKKKKLGKLQGKAMYETRN